jgi:hypothetical protein
VRPCHVAAYPYTLNNIQGECFCSNKRNASRISADMDRQYSLRLQSAKLASLSALALRVSREHAHLIKLCNLELKTDVHTKSSVCCSTAAAAQSACQASGVALTKQLQLLISQHYASFLLRDIITLDMLTSRGPALAGLNLSICKMC